MRIPAKHILLISLFLAPTLYGCGPGFPIMTGEQEALVKNVDMLVADNAKMKKRLASLEGGGGGGGGLPDVKQEIADVRKSLAETNSSLENFRQEFSFVQGSVEEADHKRAQFKDNFTSINTSLDALSQRIDKIDAQGAEQAQAVASLKTSLDALQTQINNISGTVEAVSKRTAALEEKAASAPAPAVAAAPAKAEAPKKAPAKPQEDPENVYLRGYKAVKDKDFAKATEILEGFLAAYPKHKFAGNAQYWLGEIYYARGDWEMAILGFDKVIKDYPESEKVAAATLKEGFSFSQLGSKKEARVLLQQVIDKYPKSPEAGLAEKKLKTLN